MTAKAQKYLAEKNIKGLPDHDVIMVGKSIETFERSDANKDGTLDKNEVKQLLKGTGMSVETVMSTLDIDMDGRVCLDEFLGGIVLVTTESLYRPIFNSFDKDRNGTIEVEDLVQVMRGKGYTERDIKYFIAERDLDNDGKLNYSEFIKYFFATKK